MVGMPMRQPDTFCAEDALHLRLENLVRLTQAAKAGLWCEPRIGYLDRAAVVIKSEDGVAYGFKSGLQLRNTRVG